jgi:hypothetical protein
MTKDIVDLGSVLAPSDDIVIREIDGKVLLIPLTSGIGDIEHALYTLNKTGLIIWRKLNESKTLEDVVGEIRKEYVGNKAIVEQDVLGFARELFVRGFLIEKK